ncbi:MAG TPA: hypothetical protein VI814_00950 [Candidatus Limnocylindria bacterium]
MAIEIIALNAIGLPPTRVQEWLELLQRHPLFAATELTALQLPLFVLVIPVIAAICLATWERDAVVAGLAFVFAIVGITIFLATDPVLPLLALSRDYAAAASDADRASVIAAARAVMALATTSVDVGTAILAFAWIGTASLMRDSAPFAKPTAVLAALAGATELVAVGVDLFLGTANILLLELAGALMVLWLVSAGRDLRRLGATL